MRKMSFFLLLLSMTGCASSRWQVITGPDDTILLDSVSGQTWSRASYLPNGEQIFVPYWKAMVKGDAATQPSTEASLEFPYAVPFEAVQDVFGRNAVGDAIVVTAVHGTAATIAIGNTYRIDGAYTLASHEQATLAAFATATMHNEPHRKMIAGQSLTIKQGSGTFTVFLKVEDPECPHVSFYPSDGGESFSGEYFGTGDFLPPASWRVKRQLASR